ncbi:hypothetical protein C2845_PM01G42610 [Panicum miliaceum]|uniref:Uncharacterized protein n=1 Tax=Panicum miliaceum TaxID=4540 RepID=A0A3L6TNS3_PANMI|nr:hypothetical protein C2845_PM01G42610 [Panicum miliaceum]
MRRGWRRPGRTRRPERGGSGGGGVGQRLEHAGAGESDEQGHPQRYTGGARAQAGGNGGRGFLNPPPEEPWPAPRGGGRWRLGGGEGVACSYWAMVAEIGMDLAGGGLHTFQFLGFGLRKKTEFRVKLSFRLSI